MLYCLSGYSASSSEPLRPNRAISHFSLLSMCSLFAIHFYRAGGQSSQENQEILPLSKKNKQTKKTPKLKHQPPLFKLKKPNRFEGSFSLSYGLGLPAESGRQLHLGVSGELTVTTASEDRAVRTHLRSLSVTPFRGSSPERNSLEDHNRHSWVAHLQ